MFLSKKASTFIYILLLVNISLIMSVVVFNNSFILNNNINIWKNSEEVFSHVYKKWDININTVKEYNSNGNWFIDTISCPTNVTMSWSLNIISWINTEMVLELWSIYCRWNYMGDEFRLFYSWDFSDFEKAYYKWDVVPIIKSVNTNLYLWPNLSLWSTVTATTDEGALYDKDYVKDNDLSTEYVSQRVRWAYVELDFWSNKSLWWITIKKDANWSSKYWNTWKIYFYDNSYNMIPWSTINLSSMKNTTLYQADLKSSWLINNVRYVQLYSNSTSNKYLDLREFEVYELISWWTEEIWQWERVFNDSDNTLISFDETWIGWWDLIDDDFNSDDYKVTSSSWVYYFDDFEDDDVIPRKIIFWNIEANTEYQNIFWNNYKTNAFIDKNTNNVDIINKKISEVTQWHLLLDIFNKDIVNYDLKIIYFNHDKYKNENTLLAEESYVWTWLTSNFWYIQLYNNNLSLSPTKTWNEFVFDFVNKDYWIFITNITNWNLTYRLSSYDASWSWVYLNPIDDSIDWYIEAMSNHIIIWPEKNFIWNTFTVVWYK